MKYRILKAIDIAGLTFLKPIVLLCYREEPQVQVRAIIRMIGVPILAFGAFLLLWAGIAPHHKTKSGEVPTPSVVWDAAGGIWRFHDREGEKEDAFETTGDARGQQIEQVQKRLAELNELEQRASAQVREAETAHVESLAKALAPIVTRHETTSAAIKQAQTDREEALKAECAALTPGGGDTRTAYIEKIRAHQKQTEKEREQLKAIKAEEDEIRGERFPLLVDARRAQTRIAEEKQHLTKLAEGLDRGNRQTKVDAATARLEADRAAFATATGDKAFALANQIVTSEDRIEQMRAATYAKPWTLPDQTFRSVVCVFAGFVLAAVIAIPIGVLCGLSSTFMAAMTPFIALFKPVSPIVWLPIALIIVGGFVPDPENHWLMNGLADLPLIGWLKINPAFIASAITVALCSLWPTLVNTALGVASIDRDHINVARVLRLGFWSRLFKIVIPSALPLIFAGLRISLGVGWMVLIAAELLSSSEGIGKFVWDMFNNGSSQTFAQMFVVVFVVGAIGLLLDRTMIVFQRLVSFDGAPAAI